MYKKVSVVLLLALLLALPVALAEVTVTKSLSSTAKAGEEINVTLTIKTDTFIDSLDLNEFTPEGWIITGWHIDGFDKSNTFYETRNMFYQNQDRTLSHWKFNQRFYGTIVLSYQTTPASAGTFETLTAWTFPGGFDSSVSYISVVPSLLAFPDKVVSLLPANNQQITIIGTTFDLTTILIVLIIAGALIFALVMAIAAGKKIAEIRARGGSKANVSTEDLRTFIKLGLKRGYTLRDMVNALRGGNIGTEEFDEVIKEEMIQQMNDTAEEKEATISDTYAKKLKSIIERLKG
jgi:hypothetical protein